MAPSQILVLGESLINKIAAGEVVESGASVVKELMDNALDAKATRIRIDFNAGGRQLIRISDNGCGMSFDDCLLCFERHATSKIRSFEDLSKLTSCGFRGEALSAIAAVSKIDLISCDGVSCRRVQCKGGEVVSTALATRQRGTTIEVTSLFHNTPVRAEFRPSISKESADIASVFTKVALANPQIAFQLFKDSKEIFSLAACSQNGKTEFLLRIEQLLGRAFAQELIFFKSGHLPMQFWGFISKPVNDRPNRSGQYLSINSRPIQSAIIGNAIAQGYGARLAPRRFPSFVLNGQLPPEDVDFNVHPQKKEVRFKRAGHIAHWLSSNIDARFLQTFESDQELMPSSSLPWDRDLTLMEKAKETQFSIRQDSSDALKTQHLSSSSDIELLVDPNPLHQTLPRGREPDFPLIRDQEIFSIQDGPWQRAVVAIWRPYLLLDPAPLAEGKESSWWAVHQKGGWLIFDYPKAAAWAQTQRALGKRPSSRQLLMQPLALHLSQENAELLSVKLDELEDWGLSFARIGLREFACLAIPQTLECCERSLAMCLEQWARLEDKAERERFLARWLSKQPWQLSINPHAEAARHLIAKVLQSPQPPRTANGDAIATPIYREDLAKFFKARG